MQIGLFLLALAYVLSQFFRAFLAVLTAPLQADLGVGPDVLATASGLWFLSFAAMQIPVGWALDTLGPRRTAGYGFFCLEALELFLPGIYPLQKLAIRLRLQ